MRYFHRCHSFGDDTLWGVNRRTKDAAHTLTALKTIRAARPDGAPIYIILGNLSALANSNHRNHTAQARALRAYIRRRNANARHPRALAAERQERAHIRSEKGIRWGGRPVAGAV